MNLPTVRIVTMVKIRKFSQLARLVYVLWTLASFALHVYLDSRRRETRDREKRKATLRRQAVRLRGRLIKLGPTFIKAGQMLATRADLLPVEYLDELAELQDRVPAFSNRAAMQLIESELGRPVGELFSEISESPVASASLGQVYKARLTTGEEVAVKVQRPKLEERVHFDLDLLRRVGKILDRYPKLFPGAEWLGAIDEFDRVIHEEMDYRLEAANAEEFRRNFHYWPSIHVPKIFDELSTSRVLVLEFITGVKVIDLDGLQKAGHDPRRINELIYRTYFKQLLEDGFFHADPHPGNLLVMEDGRLAVFDFGMVGRLSAELQRQMIDAFFHLYNRDYDRIVDDLINLGFLAPGADLARIRQLVTDVFARKLNLQARRSALPRADL